MPWEEYDFQTATPPYATYCTKTLLLLRHVIQVYYQQPHTHTGLLIRVDHKKEGIFFSFTPWIGSPQLFIHCQTSSSAVEKEGSAFLELNSIPGATWDDCFPNPQHHTNNITGGRRCCSCALAHRGEIIHSQIYHWKPHSCGSEFLLPLLTLQVAWPIHPPTPWVKSFVCKMVTIVAWSYNEDWRDCIHFLLEIWPDTGSTGYT